MSPHKSIWFASSWLVACAPSSVPTPTNAPAPVLAPPPPTIAAAPPEPAAVPVASTPTPTARAPGLDSLPPIHDVRIEQAWMTVTVTATDDAAWQRVMDVTTPLWVGHRLIPAEVRALGPLFVVSTTGVHRVDAFARVSAGVQGWLIDYRRGPARAPTVAMHGEPDADAIVRKGGKAQSIKRTHPMAERMRSMLADHGTEEPIRARLGRYRMQITAGTFPGATRIVAVWALGPDVDTGDFGVVFTTDDEDRVRHELMTAVDPTTIEGLVDLDGDGFDEPIVRFG